MQLLASDAAIYDPALCSTTDLVIYSLCLRISLNLHLTSCYFYSSIMSALEEELGTPSCSAPSSYPLNLLYYLLLKRLPDILPGDAWLPLCITIL